MRVKNINFTRNQLSVTNRPFIIIIIITVELEHVSVQCLLFLYYRFFSVRVFRNEFEDSYILGFVFWVLDIDNYFTDNHRLD